MVLATACSSGQTQQTQSGSDKNAPAASQKPAEIEMVVFQQPSLGAFLPAIIEENKLDIKNGIDIKFVERDPNAYNTEFASGQYPVGGSAALLSEGLRIDRGVKVSYLFNLFDFWGTLVSADPNIKTLKDVEGKTIAAAQSTTNYAMFQYFAQKSGADLSKLKLLNAGTAALMTYAEAGRADAIQMWEPGYSTLVNKNPNKFHQVEFGLDKWKEYTGASSIPYLGVAAHQSWIDSHKELIPKLYKTYVDAAEWVKSNPGNAAKIIASKIPGGDSSVIEGLIKDNKRLGMNVKPASEIADDIRSVFKAGIEINYLKQMPDDSVIYKGSLK
jgi:ABC-type nitrate/sulfonate/bicarbonate transport system substrate-binding protein